MIDYILIAASIYFFIKMITDLLNKRNEILPRVVAYNTELEEFRINKELIISIEVQKNKI
ncbi:hypothetical protein [Clostridium tertium]